MSELKERLRNLLTQDKKEDILEKSGINIPNNSWNINLIPDKDKIKLNYFTTEVRQSLEYTYETVIIPHQLDINLEQAISLLNANYPDGIPLFQNKSPLEEVHKRR